MRTLPSLVPRPLVMALALCTAGAACKGVPREGGCDPLPERVEAVPNEGWQHVDDEAELVYQHNPPASGPHLGVGWASYAIHDEVVKRGNWVHNLEHGAIVLLIGPDATDAQKQLLRDAYEATPNDPDCGHRRMVLTEDPELDSPMAAVAADLVLEHDDLTVDEIVQFAVGCRDRAPEDICY